MVPFGMGMLWCTFPDRPTIGLVKGITSSSCGTLSISITTEWRLRTSYVSVRTRPLRVQLTDLDNSICVRHIIDISRREVFLSSCPDRPVRLCNFFSKPVLDLGSPRELP
jgi:hypothetical protein